MIWFFIQKKQFKLALVQAKALDRRLKMDGEMVYELAEIFLNKNEYNLALESYNYILSKGSQNYYFIEAYINKFNVYNLKLESNEKIDLKFISNEYEKAISEIGITKLTVKLLISYAHFQAYFLNDLVISQQTLDKVLSVVNLNDKDLALCKLKYGDILLLDNKIWDALLFYSQVEKLFKETPLGHEAKLKKAKVAYYKGDFSWAQAQLDILKASTSKLISNDAMDLSLFISDNLGLDTSKNAMILFSRSELYSLQNKNDLALITYDSLINKYKGHTVLDEVYFNKAKIYLKNNEYLLAIEMLNLILDEFSFDILADDATYELAKIYQFKIKDNKKAMEFYNRILTDYEGSIYSNKARMNFRKLRGDLKEVNDTI